MLGKGFLLNIYSAIIPPKRSYSAMLIGLTTDSPAVTFTRSFRTNTKVSQFVISHGR